MLQDNCGCLTPAEEARVAAGLTPDKAAKAARICPAYLKRIERKGNAPYCLAVRLAKLYACSMHLFL